MTLLLSAKAPSPAFTGRISRSVSSNTGLIDVVVNENRLESTTVTVWNPLKDSSNMPPTITRSPVANPCGNSVVAVAVDAVVVSTAALAVPSAVIALSLAVRAEITAGTFSTPSSSAASYAALALLNAV